MAGSFGLVGKHAKVCDWCCIGRRANRLSLGQTAVLRRDTELEAIPGSRGVLWQELALCERDQGLSNMRRGVFLEAFHQDSLRSGWELGIMTCQGAKLVFYEIIDLQVCLRWYSNRLTSVVGEPQRTDMVGGAGCRVASWPHLPSGQVKHVIVFPPLSNIPY